MTTTDALSPILRSLETAAFDQDEWRRALNLMAQYFQSTIFAIRGLGAPVLTWVASEGGDEISRDYLAGGWDKADLRAHRFLETPGRRLITDADLVSAEEVRRNDFYRDFASSRGLTHLTAWHLDLSARSVAFASNRSEGVGVMTPAERAALEQLVTPASTAALVSSHIAGARDSAFHEALSASGAAAIILGTGCSVLATTPAAEQMFVSGFETKAGQLVAPHCSPTDAIRTLYAATTGRGDLEPRRLAPFTIITSAEKILCLPLLLKGAGCDVFSGAKALLIMRSLKLTEAPDRDHLVRLFGLTPSQADVASRLATGQNVAEIAAIRRVSNDTIRVMLKAAFAKVGARSQAELVAIVHRATTGIAH